MREIPLTRGKVAIVDDEDYDYLSQFKWCFQPPKYAIRYRNILMHREILNAPKGMLVDHINHNGLDNRRENLRLATHADNNHYQRLSRNNTSGYKGVSWNVGKWGAYIQVAGRLIYLGRFDDKILAAQAYDEAARQAFGEFALPNFT